MVFDAARGMTVLFGGTWIYTGLCDTWEWDGRRWTWRQSPNTPPLRHDHAMAYDPFRRRTVLFGGNSMAMDFSDTWEWDGKNWIQRKSQSSNFPNSRSHHAMAFDFAKGAVLLFGGNGGYRSDTWQWDGKDWKQLSPSLSPPGRMDHAMASDPFRKKIVLFGGYNWKGALGDTWEWDGMNWILRSPSTSPPPRFDHAMAFDAIRRVVVLFGGTRQNGVRLSDTWEWDGKNWNRISLSLSPPAMSGHAMAFDPLRGKTLLFGGESVKRRSGDTWGYGIHPTSSFSSRGKGCLGSRGLVPLLRGAGRPSLGTVIRLELKNGPTFTWSVFFLGVQPLHLDLSVLGAPGCAVLNTVQVSFAKVINFSGEWSFPPSFQVPFRTELLGKEVFFQSLFGDPSANRAGIILSNGIVAHIGW